MKYGNALGYLVKRQVLIRCASYYLGQKDMKCSQGALVTKDFFSDTCEEQMHTYVYIKPPGVTIGELRL